MGEASFTRVYLTRVDRSSRAWIHAGVEVHESWGGWVGEFHEGRAGQGKAMFTKFKALHTRKIHEGHSTCMP